MTEANLATELTVERSVRMILMHSIVTFVNAMADITEDDGIIEECLGEMTRIIDGLATPSDPEQAAAAALSRDAALGHVIAIRRAILARREHGKPFASH